LRYDGGMNIPQEVKSILNKFRENNFEAFAVGGCVRDFLLSRRSLGEGGLGIKPKDWDVATNAKPEEIQKIFPANFYENKFGTVTVKIENASDETLAEVEVTTYRVDDRYSDKRHPDSVSFTTRLEEDLARRDFTINAMALLPKDGDYEIIDPFGGQKDLEARLIRAVGDPQSRFNEDALRMLRTVRFCVQLCSVKQSFAKQCFSIEEKTAQAIKENAANLQFIAKERIRDEFVKIIMTEKAADGILMLHDLGLLEFIIPEFEKGFGVSQNKHHIYTIFEHGVFALKFAAQKKYNLIVRLAALLHDVAKPQTKRGEGPDATFYNHDMAGARVAAQVLERLKFPREIIERIANLVRNHMFVYDIGAVTEAGVRRLLGRVGPENMKDLLELRMADRMGSGVPKAQPYRLRHFQYMVEKVQKDAISVKMLKINGEDIMKILEIPPGPKIGAILDVLLAEVIEDPQKNEKEYLKRRARELNEIDLSQLRQMARERIEEEKEEEDKIIKEKYWVK